MDVKVKQELKDYLTQLFGKLNKDKREEEWREVRRQVRLKFGYTIPEQFDIDEYLNAIYFSVQYHLNFVFLTRTKPGQALEGAKPSSRQTIGVLKAQPVSFMTSPKNFGGGRTALYEVREKIELGKNEKPFESEWQLHFRPKTKVYQLRNVPYIILAQKCN